MNQFELKSKFTKEFFEEFQYDAEFRSIFEGMSQNLTMPPISLDDNYYISKHNFN